MELQYGHGFLENVQYYYTKYIYSLIKIQVSREYRIIVQKKAPGFLHKKMSVLCDTHSAVWNHQNLKGAVLGCVELHDCIPVHLNTIFISAYI